MPSIRNSSNLEDVLEHYVPPGRWHGNLNLTWTRALGREHAACSPELADAAVSVTARRLAARRKRKRPGHAEEQLPPPSWCARTR